MIHISVYGYHQREVDDDDLTRAKEAAEMVFSRTGVSPVEAEAAYRTQWEEFDDEKPMHGAALTWIEARNAADVAITATWANPGEVFCSLSISGRQIS